MKDFAKLFVRGAAACICVVLCAYLFAVVWRAVNVHDCGMCGADTVDTYHVSNMDNTEIIDVCEHCYLLCME